MMQPKRIILSILVVLLLTFCTLTAFAETQEGPVLDIVVSASSDAAIVGVDNSFGVEAGSVVDFKVTVGTWASAIFMVDLTLEYDPACLELTADGIALGAPYVLGTNAAISNPAAGKIVISYLCNLASYQFTGDVASFSFKVKDMHGDATVKVTPVVAEAGTYVDVPVALVGGISTIGVHDYGAADSVPPTCTDRGYVYRACTIDGCQDMIILEYVDALGHDESGDPATCTTHKYCARGCGEILQMKLGHDRTGPAASCLNPKVCARGCGAVLSPQLPHDASGPDADCVKDKVCANGCGTVLVPKLGHDEDGPDATCTTDKVCDRYGCNVVLVSKLGHDESAPACGENRICPRCNKKIPATAEHQFGEWAVETEATMSATGLKARTCSVCGEKETEEIPEESSTWLIILIIALVLVLGGGGFAAYWFLVKKKKATTESEETTKEDSEEKTEEATEEVTEAPAEEATEEATEEKTEE